MGNAKLLFIFHYYYQNIHCRKCAHTDRIEHNGTVRREWFSLELPDERIVTKVQIARRMDGTCHCQNISITVGPSKEYDGREPLCLPEIEELTNTAGLQDYVCTEDLRGKYVKISRVGELAICEVDVFSLSKFLN